MIKIKRNIIIIIIIIMIIFNIISVSALLSQSNIPNI